MQAAHGKTVLLSVLRTALMHRKALVGRSRRHVLVRVVVGAVSLMLFTFSVRQRWLVRPRLVLDAFAWAWRTRVRVLRLLNGLIDELAVETGEGV